MLAAFYDTAWQHPLPAFIGAGIAAVILAVRRPPLWRLGLLLAAIAAVDAFFTGAWSPLPKASAATGVIAFVFVVAGDLRFLFLVERQPRPLTLRRDPTRRQALITSLGISLAVPALSFAARLVAPSLIPSDRAFFLVYECAFIGVVILVAAGVRRTMPPGEMRRWLIGLAVFEVVQYGCWALGDVLILVAGDVGFAPRIAGNVLYYVAFAPFAVLTAPSEAQA